MFLSKFVTTLCLIFIFTLTTHLDAAALTVIKLNANEEDFSPYFAAFSERDRYRIAEYERLKRSLMYFRAIDWNVVVQPRITDDGESSS